MKRMKIGLLVLTLVVLVGICTGCAYHIRIAGGWATLPKSRLGL
jgi:hypothetical protein